MLESLVRTDVQGFAVKRDGLHDLQCLKVLKVGVAVPTSANTACTAYITLKNGFATFMENRIIFFTILFKLLVRTMPRKKHRNRNISGLMRGRVHSEQHVRDFGYRELEPVGPPDRVLRSQFKSHRTSYVKYYHNKRRRKPQSEKAQKDTQNMNHSEAASESTSNQDVSPSSATVIGRRWSIDDGFKFCNHHNAIFWSGKVGAVTHRCVKGQTVYCKLNGTFSATAIGNSSPCTGLAGHAISAIPHCLVTANDYLQHLHFAVRAYQGDAQKMKRYKLTLLMGGAQSREDTPSVRHPRRGFFARERQRKRRTPEHDAQDLDCPPLKRIRKR